MKQHSCILLKSLLFAIVLTTGLWADSIQRVVTITPDQSQISFGTFGSGYFWRPSFAIDPFVLNAGDTATITVDLSGARLVALASQAGEQQSAGAGIGLPGGQTTYYSASFEFLDVQGNPDSTAFTTVSNSEGSAIGANFNPVQLTDSSFSFYAIRYSFTILDDSRNLGLPASFNSGYAAVQTQGGFQVAPVPEPTDMSYMLTGIFALGIIQSAKKVWGRGGRPEPKRV